MFANQSLSQHLRSIYLASLGDLHHNGSNNHLLKNRVRLWSWTKETNIHCWLKTGNELHSLEFKSSVLLSDPSTPTFSLCGLFSSITYHTTFSSAPDRQVPHFHTRLHEGFVTWTQTFVVFRHLLKQLIRCCSTIWQHFLWSMLTPWETAAVNF